MLLSDRQWKAACYADSQRTSKHHATKVFKSLLFTVSEQQSPLYLLFILMRRVCCRLPVVDVSKSQKEVQLFQAFNIDVALLPFPRLHFYVMIPKDFCRGGGREEGRRVRRVIKANCISPGFIKCHKL